MQPAWQTWPAVNPRTRPAAVLEVGNFEAVSFVGSDCDDPSAALDSGKAISIEFWCCEALLVPMPKLEISRTTIWPHEGH